MFQFPSPQMEIYATEQGNRAHCISDVSNGCQNPIGAQQELSCNIVLRAVRIAFASRFAV
ncbi:hypothetical protein SKAU_G00044650 [Synaphobranchus kaupii]|uniref:Uncharacterized protein n=1 Tax=Synaphobranchus kaupii TaxID=118154 RepID=A0A9Q1G1Y4_SYNKA|nr:hypothetical protein SKAU_G00044650 [Synaphobranchus kaupii]